jgi:hypothetical protein
MSLDATEALTKKSYMEDINSGDSTWWNSEIKSLNERISNNKDVVTKQMYCRIKGFLGIVCYSYTNQAVMSNNIGLSNKYFFIYEKLEPKNPDLFFFKALLLDKNNQPEKAVIMLKKAIEYGFTNEKKIRDMFSKKVQNAVIGY